MVHSQPTFLHLPTVVPLLSKSLAMAWRQPQSGHSIRMSLDKPLAIGVSNINSTSPLSPQECPANLRQSLATVSHVLLLDCRLLHYSSCLSCWTSIRRAPDVDGWSIRGNWRSCGVAPARASGYSPFPLPRSLCVLVNDVIPGGGDVFCVCW